MLLFFMNTLQGMGAGALTSTGLSASQLLDVKEVLGQLHVRAKSCNLLLIHSRLGIRSDFMQELKGNDFITHTGRASWSMGVWGVCWGRDTAGASAHVISGGHRAVCSVSQTLSHTGHFSSCLVPIPSYLSKKREIRVYLLSHYRCSYKFLPERKQKQREKKIKIPTHFIVSHVLNGKFSILR